MDGSASHRRKWYETYCLTNARSRSLPAIATVTASAIAAAAIHPARPLRTWTHIDNFVPPSTRLLALQDESKINATFPAATLDVAIAARSSLAALRRLK